MMPIDQVYKENCTQYSGLGKNIQNIKRRQKYFEKIIDGVLLTIVFNIIRLFLKHCEKNNQKLSFGNSLGTIQKVYSYRNSHE